LNGAASAEKPDLADWTKFFQRKSAMEGKSIKTWVLYHPSDLAKKGIHDLVVMMREQGRKLGLDIQTEPIIQMYDAGHGKKFEETLFMQQMNKVVGLQLVFYVLPNNQLPRYAAVKSACTMRLNVLSQCFLKKHLEKPPGTLRSVVQKVVIQLIAKFGGVPWSVLIPPQAKPMMIMGFDIYHCPDPRRAGQTVGALVATMDADCTKYHSVTAFHKNQSELAMNLRKSVQECLVEYRKRNEVLPERLVLYRDGVGEGQIDVVVTNEVDQVMNAVREQYKLAGQGDKDPELVFIIVTKKINTRLMTENAKGDWNNPLPGTVVDSGITLPGRNEFFMISQTVRQGTVSPTNYNILTKFAEKSIFTTARIETLTYKQCHMYYNWSGTVAVPAPCQYAHKLAFLTGMALADDAGVALRDRLWYL